MKFSVANYGVCNQLQYLGGGGISAVPKLYTIFIVDLTKL